MKKILLSICVFLVFIISQSAISSCTKTVTQVQVDTVIKTVTDTLVDSVKPAPTIVGFWVGTYQVSGVSTSYYLSFDLRPDGTMLYKATGADGNTYYAQGTYTLTGTNFSYSFTALNLSQAGAVQTGTGVYNSTANTIVGNWQNVGATILGTYTLSQTH